LGVTGLTRLAVAGVPLLLVPALGAVQGGFDPDAWVWAGALAGWAAALGLTLTGRSGALRRAWPWPAAGGALLLWTLASSLWSVEPAQSVLEARRTVVYVAAALAVVVLARTGSSWTLVVATHVAITTLVGYSLLRYLLGVRRNYAFEGHLISQPLGYANAVGILAVLGLLLALAAGVAGRRPVEQAAAAATAPFLTLALAFSGSRGGWLALAVGLAAVAVLAPDQTRLWRAVAAAAIPSAPLVWVAHASRFTHPGTPAVAGGVVLAAAGGAAVIAALLSRFVAVDRPPPLERLRPRPRAAVFALFLLAGTIVVFTAAAGGQPRTAYFHVAWHEFLAHPVLGSGAGTFGRYWLEAPYYLRYGGALDAHSLYLETLAELGPAGLLLLLCFLLVPFRASVAARRMPGVPVAAGAAVAFLVHAGIDWDWELPAVVVAGLCCLAAVIAADDREEQAEVPVAGRLAAIAAAIVLGLAAIAGTASHAQPSAAETTGAP
jgi:O-antigen ligase